MALRGRRSPEVACVHGGMGRLQGDILVSEGPVQETPALTLTSPSKALGLKPLTSSAVVTSECRMLGHPTPQH